MEPLQLLTTRASLATLSLIAAATLWTSAVAARPAVMWCGGRKDCNPVRFSPLDGSAGVEAICEKYKPCYFSSSCSGVELCDPERLKLMRAPLTEEEKHWIAPPKIPDIDSENFGPDGKEAELVRPRSPECSQELFHADKGGVPPSKSLIPAKRTVEPFYQWQNNWGYCGEVSLIQAGLNNGQWVSQYNARLLCGTSLSQAGPSNWCPAHRKLKKDGGISANYNAQLLLETPDTGVSGKKQRFGSAPICLANYRLSARTYPYQTGFLHPNLGKAGYQDFMSWIKSEVIAGRQVTIGVLNGGGDAQYDHIVSVVQIGTNYDPHDIKYFPDDVLYFDDHGSLTRKTLSGKTNSNDGNPEIPYGAQGVPGCTPYIFAYTVESLAQASRDPRKDSAPPYSIVIPGDKSTTKAGGDGVHDDTPIIGHNYGFSVSGPIDNSIGGPFLTPVSVSVTQTTTDGRANPKDPTAGYQYENNMIGAAIDGSDCTNDPPKNFMRPINLTITISGLKKGVEYNVYEYDLTNNGLRSKTPRLDVPTHNFNGDASKKKKLLKTFTATEPVFSIPVGERRSDHIIIFRVVPKDAP